MAFLLLLETHGHSRLGVAEVVLGVDIVAGVWSRSWSHRHLKFVSRGAWKFHRFDASAACHLFDMLCLYLLLRGCVVHYRLLQVACNFGCGKLQIIDMSRSVGGHGSAGSLLCCGEVLCGCSDLLRHSKKTKG